MTATTSAGCASVRMTGRGMRDPRACRGGPGVQRSSQASLRGGPGVQRQRDRPLEAGNGPAFRSGGPPQPS